MTDGAERPGIVQRVRESRFGVALAEQRAGVLVALIALVLYLWFYFSLRASLMPGNSDPHYIWLYARSLVFDGDFNFANDYRVCGDPFALGRDFGTGHPANPYYAGPSLFLAPALWLVKLVVHLPAGAPPDVVAGCRGPLAAPAMGVGCLLGALSLYASYRVARRCTSDGPAAVSAALFGWGGLLAAYSGMWPGYSHVFATFGVALLALLSVRAAERPESWLRWSLVALAVAIGVWQRPPQLVYGLLPLVLAIVHLRSDRKRLAGVLGILALGAVFGVAPLLLLYKYMYGSYTTSPVSGEYLHLGSAHPFLLLFAPHGGLFFVTPVAWLAVAGLWPALRMRELRPLLIPLLFAGAVEGYLYSAGLDWHASGTFGARRLTPLTPLFVVLGAVVIAKLAAWLRDKPERALSALALAIVVPVAITTQGGMIGQSKGTISCCSGTSQAELYGEGVKSFWHAVDESVGDVAVWPAALVFAARYRVHPNRWQDATESHLLLARLPHHAVSRSVVQPRRCAPGHRRLRARGLGRALHSATRARDFRGGVAVRDAPGGPRSERATDDGARPVRNPFRLAEHRRIHARARGSATCAPCHSRGAVLLGHRGAGLRVRPSRVRERDPERRSHRGRGQVPVALSRS